MAEPAPGSETFVMPEPTSRVQSTPGLSDPAAARGELEIGTVLGGRYEILQMLGIGGMGAVYKAKDLELDRLVALKVIRPQLANNPSIIDRFKQELILARQVTHKNVVRVFDLGVAGDVKFITMEFIEGQTLASVMSERKFTPAESTRIIQQMCRALEAALFAFNLSNWGKATLVRDGESGAQRVQVEDSALAASVPTQKSESVILWPATAPAFWKRHGRGLSKSARQIAWRLVRRAACSRSNNSLVPDEWRRRNASALFF